MKYRSFDDERGYPPRFYRSPEEVKEEMEKIKNSIKEINKRLNIRELMTCLHLGNHSYEGSVYKFLSESLQFAIDTLSELSDLEDTLDKLKEEYIEVMEIFGNQPYKL